MNNITNTAKSVIRIQKGNEYHVLVDETKNIYDKSIFFYTVYKKSAELLEEICQKSKAAKDNIDISSNNLIMYCAERGGGKSTAMRSFANVLGNISDEKKKEGFSELFKNNIVQDCEFFVLKVIDPTAIGSKELFMRIILSRMFAALRSKLEKENNDIIYRCENNFDSLISKFTECYRLLDVIYQNGGEFSCDDDIEDLTNLGDSCKLREKFSELVQHYLRVFIGNNHCENNFLVIQIDDADLNSKMAFNIIEDIRKYCIVPNVVILMAVHMVQMRQVLEQHFVNDFDSLLKAGALSNEDIKPVRLKDCQRMAARYIDKVMPAGHQIHLPAIDEYIGSRSSELTIEYYDKDNNNLLSFKDVNNKKVLTDYQEILLRLIYEKTGIPLVKATGYLHNILPKTMRGLSHFLAYMSSLEDLNTEYSIAEINMFCNRQDDIKLYPETSNKTIEEAKTELAKRKRNLDALEQYFMKNWCPVRLTQSQREAIENIAAAVSEQKISLAIKLLDRLFKNVADKNASDIFFNPPLSRLSYSYLLEKLRKIGNLAHNTDDASETYRFTYAIKFYFTLFFNRLILKEIDSEGKFDQIIKISNLEVWEPRFENLITFVSYPFIRFEVDIYALVKVYKEITENHKIDNYISFDDLIEKNCIINNSKINHYAAAFNLILYLKKNNNTLKQSSHIICDFGSLLLGYACNDLSNIEFFIKNRDLKEIKYENLTTCQNNIFMLLLNWDLQRCAEKSEFNGIYKESDFVGVNSLRREIIYQVFEYFSNTLKYLPITWNMDKIFDIMDKSMVILQSSSPDIAPNLAFDIITILTSDFKSLNFNLQNAPNINTYKEMFHICSSSAETIKNHIEQIRYLSVFSEEIKTIIELWDEIYSKISAITLELKKCKKNIKNIPAKIDTLSNNLSINLNNWIQIVQQIKKEELRGKITDAFKNN